MNSVGIDFFVDLKFSNYWSTMIKLQGNNPTVLSHIRSPFEVNSLYFQSWLYCISAFGAISFYAEPLFIETKKSLVLLIQSRKVNPFCRAFRENFENEALILVVFSSSIRGYLSLLFTILRIAVLQVLTYHCKAFCWLLENNHHWKCLNSVFQSQWASGSAEVMLKRVSMNEEHKENYHFCWAVNKRI